MEFVHQRHKSPSDLTRPRDMILAVPPLRSSVNLSRILRAAGCFGIENVIVAGDMKVDAKIARDSTEFVKIERRRSMRPALLKLKRSGHVLVGLEQATGSIPLSDFRFPKKCVLVIGHERLGIDEETLSLLDAVVEIPVFGRPLSFNVATATAIALYEYSRQQS